MTETADPLYHWKKHSGFKKGLLTDIVFGDEAIGNNSYVTTTQSQFQKVENPVDNRKYAGRSSGFEISDKTQKHIVFGDPQLGGFNLSVTGATFVPHAVSGTESVESSAPILKYHTKPLTITSAAHVGAQTRQDLPIDDNHFRNFTTTTADTYRTSNKSVGRTIYGARPSKLYFGDQGRPNDYQTTQCRSFVPHDVSVPVLKQKEFRKTCIFNTTVTDEDLEDMYETTLSSAYKGLPTNDNGRDHAIIVPKVASNIQFGQNPECCHTSTSVTKSDYSPKADAVPTKRERFTYFPGIEASLKPGQSAAYTTSHNIAYKICPQNDKPAAGKVRSGPIDPHCDQVSSVPVGDQNCYNLAFASATTADAFKDYKGKGFNERVKLGSHYRRTQIFHSSDNPSSFETSTNADFQPFTLEEMKMTRQAPVNPYAASHKLGYDNHVERKSTQHLHYLPITENCTREPQLPLLAKRNRFFPTSDTNLNLTTTMDNYFGKRDKVQ